MKFRAVCFVLLLTSACASAQHLDFGIGGGVKGGWGATDVAKYALGSSHIPSTGQYIVGPVVELRLPFGFAAEVDGLYHHADLSIPPTTGGSGTPSFSSWEVPYMAKFRFPIPLIKPFILGGGTYRKFNSALNASNNGFVGGLGIELRIARLRLSAEGRYVRWGESTTPTTVSYPRNQGEVLFGLIF